MARCSCSHALVSAALAAICGLLATACTPQRPAIRSYAMGEKAAAGLIVYSVLESVWRSQLGESHSPRLPRHRFLLLRLGVTNGGPSEAAIPLTTLVSAVTARVSDAFACSARIVLFWIILLNSASPAPA